MTTRSQFFDQTGQSPFQMPTSDAGLRADRTDISFQNISPDVVRVNVHVSNEGSLWSPPSQVILQSAQFGAFLTWQPLFTLSVPSLAPHTSTVVSGSAFTPQAASETKNEDELWFESPRLLQALAEEAEREAREEAERLARKEKRRAAPVLAADTFALVRRQGAHWAGNIDILMRGKQAERHVAQALRVYPGRPNAAMFFVGDRLHGYKFELSGEVDEWQAGVLAMTNHPTMNPNRAPEVPTGEFQEFTRGTFHLLMHPPKDAERGDVSVHVTRQSDGMEAVVEFCLDSRAAGAGCYKI